MSHHDIEHLEHKDPLSQAYFMNKYATDFGWSFLQNINQIFSGNDFVVYGQIKQNLSRIAENIEKNEIDDEDER